jgi:hypothetical protein
MAQLQREIATVAQEKAFQPIVAQSWVQLYDRLCNVSDNRVHWNRFYRWARECRVPHQDIASVTQFLCDVGVLVHFGSRTRVPSDASLVASSPGAASGIASSTSSSMTSTSNAAETIIWSLENLVVLKPQWLADVMRRLVTVSCRWVKNGIVAANDIPHLFKDIALQEQVALLELCEKFNVAIRMGASGDILVCVCVCTRHRHHCIAHMFYGSGAVAIGQ